MSGPDADVDLRPWGEDDLPLLERLLADPEMTTHLGGPESPEQLRARHARYLALNPAVGTMLVIVAGAERLPAGSVGFWERAETHGPVWETGWLVLPEFQGRGIATRAAALVVERARVAGRHRYLHAYPAVDNAPSNAICRSLGFTLLGPRDFDYRGHPMVCNDWALDLQA